MICPCAGVLPTDASSSSRVGLFPLAGERFFFVESSLDGRLIIICFRANLELSISRIWDNIIELI